MLQKREIQLPLEAMWASVWGQGREGHQTEAGAGRPSHTRLVCLASGHLRGCLPQLVNATAASHFSVLSSVCVRSCRRGACRREEPQVRLESRVGPDSLPSSLQLRPGL